MSTNMQCQRRFKQSLECRVEKRSDDLEVITGYAAVFYDANDAAGTEYDLGYGMRERIMPGAFNRALTEKQDVRGLGNHDDNWLLGRTSAGTMALSIDSRGLKYEITVNPNDPDHVRAVQKLQRGDLSGSSFGFIPVSIVWRDVDEQSFREIEDVDLYDVGPVTFPAYTGTSAGMRSAPDSDVESIKREREEWRSKNATTQEATSNDADLVELCMAELDMDGDE